MFAKLAAAIVAVILAAVAAVQPEPPAGGGYPAPAEPAEYAVVEPPAKPTATPVTLPAVLDWTPAPTAQPGYQLVCLHIAATVRPDGGTFRWCDQYGYEPLPTPAPPTPAGYPAP